MIKCASCKDFYTCDNTGYYRECKNAGNVLQFSVDVEDDGSINADLIREMLESLRVSVLGCEWKATWTRKGYDLGEPPVSCD